MTRWPGFYILQWKFHSMPACAATSLPRVDDVLASLQVSSHKCKVMYYTEVIGSEDFRCGPRRGGGLGAGGVASGPRVARSRCRLCPRQWGTSSLGPCLAVPLCKCCWWGVGVCRVGAQRRAALVGSPADGGGSWGAPDLTPHPLAVLFAEAP